MTNKKVLVIIYTSSFGGPHNQVKQLNRGLQILGYQYDLCVPASDQAYQAELQQQNVRVYNYEPSRIRFKNPVYHLFLYLINFPKDVKNYIRIIKTSECEIVQICGLMCLQAGIAAKLAGRPIVWQLLSTFAPPVLRLFFMPFVALFSSSIMTTGTSTAKQHPFFSVWKKKNIPFYPPVKEELFQPSAEQRSSGRAHLGFDSDDFIIGTLGNKNRQKNHASLVDLIVDFASMYSEHPKFLISGTDNPEYLDEYRTTVIEKAEANGLFRKGLLVITSSSLGPPTLLNTMNVFILTSISEGTPTVIIEALACGKPIIAPNVGSIAEMLEGNPFCLVYDKIDLAEIKEHVEKIIAADPLVVQETCVKHYQSRLSYEACLNSHVKAFNSCYREG